MNRNVMGRQMFANGGPAVAEMDPMMMQGAAPEMDPMRQGTVAAAQEQVDPNVLAGVFGRMDDQVTGIEGAEDIEGMINAVRGDEQPIEARRAELAGLVGPEDAEATPDSVLALVQPVVQLAAVDQGIGALAAEDMGAVSMEGPMSEGIMSTVDTAMPAEQVMVEPPMEMGVGNQPPVNFNQGGVVRPVIGMQVGGEPGAFPNVDPNFLEIFEGQKALRRSIRDDHQAYSGPEYQHQDDLTKAQMYFDLANTALAFATPGSRQMSPAERLAEAAQETKLFDKMGARFQKQRDAIRELDKERLAFDLAALDATQEQVLADKKIAASGVLKGKNLDRQLLTQPDVLKRFADGTLDEAMTNQVEMAIGNIYGAKEFTDPRTGLITMTSGAPLTRAIKEAYWRRQENVEGATQFPNIFKPGRTVLDTIADLEENEGTRGPEQKTETASQQKEKQERAEKIIEDDHNEILKQGGLSLPAQVLETSRFKKALLNDSGSIDLDSPFWRMMPTVIYQKGVDYGQMRGVGSVPTRALEILVAGAREVGSGVKRTEVDLSNLQADADYRVLRLKTLGLLSSLTTEGRVLKSVQDQINENLEKIKPGVWSFDEKTLAQINGLRKTLAGYFNDMIPSLPEYGGSADANTEEYRKQSKILENLLAEYTKFHDHLKEYIQTDGYSTDPLYAVTSDDKPADETGGGGRTPFIEPDLASVGISNPPSTDIGVNKNFLNNAFTRGGK